MGVRIMEGNREGDSQGACLYCSTTTWAFGPICEDADQEEAFCDWLAVDPRSFSDSELTAKYSDFLVYLEEKPKEDEVEEEA